MLQNFFKWCASLTIEQALGLLGLLALIMSIIPYWKVLAAFLRHLIFPKPLAIESFRYHFLSTETGNELTEAEMAAPEFIVNGSALMLSWKATGAWRIDIESVGKNLKGNAALIIFHGDRLRYSLTAHGFFCRPIVHILEIPLTSVYRLEKKEISRTSIAQEPLARIESTPFTQANVVVTPLTAAKQLNSKLFPKVAGLYTGRLVCKGEGQKALYQKLDQHHILRSYSFSTKKYPNSIH